MENVHETHASHLQCYYAGFTIFLPTQGPYPPIRAVETKVIELCSIINNKVVGGQTRGPDEFHPCSVIPPSSGLRSPLI